MSIINTITRFGAQTARFVSENQGTIKLVGGLALGVAGGVLACKATVKAKEILDERKKTMEDIETVTNNPEYKDRYSEEDRKKDIRTTNITAGVKLFKAYVVPVALSVAGIALIVNGHTYQVKKTASAISAIGALQTAYSGMRGEGSPEKDVEVQEVKKTNENGEEELIEAASKVKDPYCRFYYKDSKLARIRYDNLMDDLAFLKTKSDMLTAKLRANGFLYLNDAYEEIGFDKTALGNFVGWTVDYSDKTKGNYVDIVGCKVDRVETDPKTGETYSTPDILVRFNVEPEPITGKLVKNGIIKKF